LPLIIFFLNFVFVVAVVEAEVFGEVAHGYLPAPAPAPKPRLALEEPLALAREWAGDGQVVERRGKDGRARRREEREKTKKYRKRDTESEKKKKKKKEEKKQPRLDSPAS
jgi:hypothetical protein